MATNSNSALPTYGEVQTILTPINGAITSLQNDALLKSEFTNITETGTFNLKATAIVGYVDLDATIVHYGPTAQITFNRLNIFRERSATKGYFSISPCYNLLGRTVQSEIMLTDNIAGAQAKHSIKIFFTGSSTVIYFESFNDSLTHNHQADFVLSTTPTIITIF